MISITPSFAETGGDFAKCDSERGAMAQKADTQPLPGMVWIQLPRFTPSLKRFKGGSPAQPPGLTPGTWSLTRSPQRVPNRRFRADTEPGHAPLWDSLLMARCVALWESTARHSASKGSNKVWHSSVGVRGRASIWVRRRRSIRVRRTRARVCFIGVRRR